MTDRLFVHDWDQWQTYRSDRKQPPWIKVHRALLRDLKWIELNDIEKGHMVSLWMLAADRNGELPTSARVIQKLCHLDQEPDINRLIEIGFLEWRQADANVTPERRQPDPPDIDTDTDTDTDTDAETDKAADAAVTPTYPRGLNVNAWREYLAYRRESRHKRLTDKAAEKQMRWLVEQGDQRHQAAIVNESIRNQWQGLFPLKDGNHESNSRPGRQSAADRAAWQAEHDARVIAGELG